MLGRTRTTKKLAQRIDLNYFKKVYLIPRWRRILSVGLTGVALLWLGWEALAGKERPYNAGPLSHPHALLTQDCSACHVADATFGRKVTDQACLGCHDGPQHQAQQTFTPRCTDCHVEHKASPTLTAMRDESCTQCHANLKTASGQPQFANVSGFSSGHPEFAALKKPDPGTARFNHQVHLKKDLRGAHGPVELKCSNCHVRGERTMALVNYQAHCAECHPLQFDKRFSGSVPHDKPEVIQEFLLKEFTAYIARHPDEVHLPDPPPDPRIVRPPLPPAKDAAEWISRRMSDSNQLLWRKTCKECHSLGVGSELPVVVKTAIAERWMTHAVFDHAPHQMVACTECHARARDSRETSDVLLPGIKICQTCHQGGSARADDRCSECHVYHDWSKEKAVEGKYLLKQF